MFAVSAKFNGTGENFYLNGRNQFDTEFEHAREFDDIESANAAVTAVRSRVWKRGGRPCASPDYSVTMV